MRLIKKTMLECLRSRVRGKLRTVSRWRQMSSAIPGRIWIR